MNSKRVTAQFRVFQHAGSLFFCSVIVLLATARDAHAYIDPGSGALILQMLLSACFGALFYFRGIFRRVISWFRGVKQKPTRKRE